VDTLYLDYQHSITYQTH